MKLKIIELEKDKIRVIVEGEGHTFMNVLTDEILADPAVDVAKYIIKFQFSDPELLVTIKEGCDKDPADVIKDAAQRLNSKCDDLLNCLKN
ncbi:MAG TPA: DNA-directed RNA polymerase subunit L [Methanocorpusculum sp.]|nr:DNA-directed RNA polymerase subunit L [Methanocorpusculum sp.]